MQEPIRKITSLNCPYGTVVNVRLNHRQASDLQGLSELLEGALEAPISKTLVIRRALARYLRDANTMTKELLFDEGRLITTNYRK